MAKRAADSDEDSITAELSQAQTVAVDAAALLLQKKAKSFLVDLAKAEGVEAAGTKPQLATAIAKARILAGERGTEEEEKPKKKRGKKAGAKTAARRQLAQDLGALADPPAEDVGDDAPAAPPADPPPAPSQRKVLGDALRREMKKHTDCVCVKVGDIKSHYRNSKQLTSVYAAAQEVPSCDICEVLWMPHVQAGDLGDHFTGSKHVGKKSRQKKGEEGQVTIVTAFEASETALHDKIAKGVLYTGITAGAMQGVLSCLAGTRIPKDPPKVAPLVKKLGDELTKDSEKVITAKLKGGRYCMSHDNSGIGDTKATAIILSAVGFAASLIFIRPEERRGSQTGVELSQDIKRELTRLSLPPPFLIRSDKGGSNAAASRELAEAFGVPFVSCVPHLVNNCGDVCETWMLANLEKKFPGCAAFEVSRLLNNLLGGDENKYRHRRWVEVQMECLSGVAVSSLETILGEVEELREDCTPQEEADLFESCAGKIRAALRQPNEAVSTATTLKDILPAAHAVLDAAKKNNTKEKVPAVKCPLPGDTRYSSRIEVYTHVRQRMKALFVFVSTELQQGSTTPSMGKLGQLLKDLGVTRLEKELLEMERANSPIMELLASYTTPSKKSHSHSVWGDMEGKIQDLDNIAYAKTEKEKEFLEREKKSLEDLLDAKSPVAAVLSEELKVRWWGNKSEGSYYYWKAMRHVNPRAVKIMGNTDNLMSFQDITAWIPAFREVEEAAWVEYVDHSKKEGMKGDVDSFWLNYGECALRTLCLDLLAVTASTLGCDSVFSIARRVLPPSRMAAHASTRARILFHACNQDLPNQFDRTLRKGYPAATGPKVVEWEDDILQPTTIPKNVLASFEEAVSAINAHAYTA